MSIHVQVHICVFTDCYTLHTNVHVQGTGKDRAPLPSLVVCPPTLTGHWLYEVEKFCSSEHLKPLLYSGAPIARARYCKYVHVHVQCIDMYHSMYHYCVYFTY